MSRIAVKTETFLLGAASLQPNIFFAVQFVSSVLSKKKLVQTCKHFCEFVLALGQVPEGALLFVVQYVAPAKEVHFRIVQNGAPDSAAEAAAKLAESGVEVTLRVLVPLYMSKRAGEPGAPTFVGQRVRFVYNSRSDINKNLSDLEANQKHWCEDPVAPYGLEYLFSRI